MGLRLRSPLFPLLFFSQLFFFEPQVESRDGCQGAEENGGINENMDEKEEGTGDNRDCF